MPPDTVMYGQTVPSLRVTLCTSFIIIIIYSGTYHPSRKLALQFLLQCKILSPAHFFISFLMLCTFFLDVYVPDINDTAGRGVDVIVCI
jgi:hypothetical protein